MELYDEKIALYERMIKEKDEAISLLHEVLKDKKQETGFIPIYIKEALFRVSFFIANNFMYQSCNLTVDKKLYNPKSKPC